MSVESHAVVRAYACFSAGDALLQQEVVKSTLDEADETPVSSVMMTVFVFIND